MHLTAACDVAQAVGSACAHASQLPGNLTDAQYSAEVSHAVRNLIGSFLDDGPLFWLGLLLVVWALRWVFSAFGSGLVVLLFGPKQGGSK